MRNEPGCLGTFSVILIIVGLTVGLALFLQDRIRSEHEVIVAMLPMVQDRGLKLFTSLDTNGNDILEAEELRNHLKDPTIELSADDVQVIEFLSKHCKQIGHAVGSYRSGKYTYTVYAISRSDLKNIFESAKKYWSTH